MKKVNPAVFAIVSDLFKKNNWDIDEGNNSSLFTRYIDMMSVFDESERELIRDLSLELLYYKTEDYFQRVRKLVEKIFIHNRIQKKIFVSPIQSDYQTPYANSSSFITYLTLCKEYNYWGLYDDKAYKILTKEKNIRKLAKAPRDYTLVLIDDFIGSGDTVLDAMDVCLESGVPESNIIIGTLVIARNALDRIKRKYSETPLIYLDLARSLEDIYKNKDLQDIKEIKTKIKDITQKYEVKYKHSLGYEDSMLLAIMIRSPNNTLPIFWADNNSFIPPFRRYYNG